MSRDIIINGETMVSVKGRNGSAISDLQQLGLAESAITVTPDFRYDEIQVDAWGEEIPMDVQWKLAGANVSMNLVHWDKAILQACLAESMGGAAATDGSLARAGQRLGGNTPVLSAGNHFIQVSLSSPVLALPWLFYACYLVGPPVVWPLGTKRSVLQVNWRVIPFTVDPWGGGTGAQGVQLWSHVTAT